MAEINMPAVKTGRKGVRRSKKLSTRVDLTPMVDLGFLLITFFIFSTTLSKPRSMKLFLPAEGPPSKTGESSTLTIIPFDNNRVFYYHGSLARALKENLYGFTNASVNSGIGNIIRQKQAAMNVFRPGSGKEMMLLIKPAKTATYENVVRMLDEVMINAVSRHALTEITKEETGFLQTHRP